MLPDAKGRGRGNDRFQRQPLRKSDYPLGRAVVCRLPDQLSPARRMMKARGVSVDHATRNRWVLQYAPALEKQFRQRQRPVGTSWRLDETDVHVKGQWKS